MVAQRAQAIQKTENLKGATSLVVKEIIENDESVMEDPMVRRSRLNLAKISHSEKIH